MREIIQGILSVFFGLVPLLILLSRLRNRNRRAQAAPSRNASESKPNPENRPEERERRRPWHSPLPWENETMLRVRNMYRVREQETVDLPPEEPQPPSVNAESESSEESVPLEERPTFSSTLAEEMAIRDNEQNQVYDRDKPIMKPRPFFPEANSYHELQRAVLFAEILGAPRSLREWEPLS